MFELMNIGKRALQITEKNIQTTGHNIANINTEGYSRQRIIQQASDPISDAIGVYGTGVDIERIERVRDEQLDKQYREYATTDAYWSNTADSMKTVDALFTEPSDSGLTELMNNFWNKWDSVANNPQSTVNRTDLLEATDNLTGKMQSLYTSITAKRQELNTKVEGAVDRINEITSELAKMNVTINQNESDSGEASDLKDRYDLLLDELSTYGNVRVFDHEKGYRTIYFGNDEIVKFDQSRKLKTTSTTDNGADVTNVVWDNLEEVNGLKGGILESTKTVRDDLLVSYQSQLDELAVSLVDKVNSIHRSGYDLSDPTQSGRDFFDAETTSAANIRISNEIKGNPDFICASSNGKTADNQIALQISALRTETTIEGKSFADYYAKLLSNVGSDTATAKSTADQTESTLSQVDNFRESVKGVSLNEETTNLLKYQQIYQAAAKIVSIADKMLGVIIGLVD